MLGTRQAAASRLWSVSSGAVPVPVACASLHSHRFSTGLHGFSNDNVQPSDRPQLRCAGLPEAVEGSVSLYAISDLHTDHHANMAWVQDLPTYKSNSSSSSSSNSTDGSLADTSVLLVAGDISDDMGLLRATLEALVSKFDVVSFVPGNHELWVKGVAGSPEAALRNSGAVDSIAKLHKVLELCQSLGVLTQPAQIGGLLLVPLLAWHHQSWDKEADIPGIPRASAMTVADYAACIWPSWLPDHDIVGSDEIAAWFDAANDSIQQPGWSRLQQVLQRNKMTNHRIVRRSDPTAAAAAAAAAGNAQQQQQQQQVDTVSFSHFLPHQDLLPEKRFLSYPNLAKAVGSDYLWDRLQQIQPHMHVFGHSHFAWDSNLHGIRCVQAPLCYPNERRHRVKSIILQNTPHGSSSSGSSSCTGQQQQQNMRSHDHHVSNVPWLPVRVYKARYTAQLVTAATVDQQQQQQPLSSSQCASLLWQHGLPTLHPSQLHTQDLQQQQEQQGDIILQPSCPAASSSSSGSSSSSFYQISEWQCIWVPNLFGVWSEYYKVTPREPDIVELAPWVAKRYQKYPRLARRMAGKS